MSITHHDTINIYDILLVSYSLIGLYLIADSIVLPYTQGRYK